ncbi:DNA polymerase-3 subunit delta' [Proteiniborus ethanoligenes]|uniref:DNA polymerase III subunit delta' n=1 Tax=Proteiniborus ethanoligenes TaxID=415015 RepID=A0A1H3PE17_9FIRM|nr:DNA polymerase III subunit delta' [Proteiniborus ethanoligenes]SDY99055.1 DNA polymerase-3 subunit delta' [Proteiniborus ethanoligenes]
MDFEDIIGHENIIEGLKNAIRNDLVSHSYLFEGPKSIGKERLAKSLAKTLLCQRGGDSPCNKCSSCIKFDSGNHPDFHIEYPDGNSFKKEQIDELQRSIIKIPLESDRKVYILDHVDKMTQSAQNSFLKTLEEPPRYAVLILLGINSYSLLPTIVSRCQLIKFNSVDKTIIEKALISIYDKTEEQARFITSFSNGIVGRAIELSKSDSFKSLRDETIEILDTVTKGDKLKVYFGSDFFEKNKENIDEIMDIVLIWYRDLIVYKETENIDFIINRDKIDIIISQCKNLSRMKINDIIDTVVKTKDDIHANVNYQLAIEVMLLKIQEVEIW